MIKHLLITLLAVTETFTSLLAQRQVISGGHTYSVALGEDGKVYAWGINDALQLGLQEVRPGELKARALDFQTNIPQPLAGLPENIVSIDAGTSSHVMVLTSDGEVIGWGSNKYGELGNSNYPIDSAYAQPVYVQNRYGTGNLTGVKAIAGASHASYAVLEDGRVLAWGQNNRYQLGNNNTIHTSQPGFVRNLSGNTLQNIIDISAGDNMAYALTKDGYVYSWGDNNYNYALGNGFIAGNYARNVLKDENTPLDNIKILTAGDTHGAAIDNQGNIWTWGGDWGGQQGNGEDQNPQWFAQKVKGGDSGEEYLGDNDRIVKVAAAQQSTLVITETGKAYFWGKMGGSCSTQYDTPTLIEVVFPELNGLLFTEASDGDHWYFLRDTEGYTYGIGSNFYDQLGGQPSTFSDCNTAITLISDKLKLNCSSPLIFTNTENICKNDSFEIISSGYPAGFASKWFVNNKLIEYTPSKDTYTYIKRIQLNTSNSDVEGTIKIELIDERNAAFTCPVISTSQQLAYAPSAAIVWDDLNFCDSDLNNCNVNSITLPQLSATKDLYRIFDIDDNPIEDIDISVDNCFNLNSGLEYKTQNITPIKDTLLNFTEDQFQFGFKSSISPTSDRYIEFEVRQPLQFISFDFTYIIFTPSTVTYNLFIVDVNNSIIWSYDHVVSVPLTGEFETAQIPVDATFELGNYKIYATSSDNSANIALYRYNENIFPYEHTKNELITYLETAEKDLNGEKSTNASVMFWNWAIEIPKSVNQTCPINTFTIKENCGTCTPPSAINLSGSSLSSCIGNSAAINIQISGTAQDQYYAGVVNFSGDTIMDFFPMFDNDTILNYEVTSASIYEETLKVIVSDASDNNEVCQASAAFLIEKPPFPQVSFSPSSYVLCENETFNGPNMTIDGDLADFQWLKNGLPYLAINQNWVNQPIMLEDQGHYTYGFSDVCTASSASSQEVSLTILPLENPNCSNTLELDETVTNTKSFYYVDKVSEFSNGSTPGTVQIIYGQYEQQTGHSCCPGNYLLARTSADADKFIWTDTVDVISGKYYLFSGWFNNMSKSEVLPEIAMYIDGEEIGRTTLSEEGFKWEYVERSWLATESKKVVLGIKNLKEIPNNLKTTALTHLTIGLDDISFVSLKESIITTTNPATPIKQSIVAYPNPTTGKITIDGASTDEVISILDITGSLISQTALKQNEVDLGSFPSGLYFIEIQDQVIRVIKE